MKNAPFSPLGFEDMNLEELKEKFRDRLRDHVLYSLDALMDEMGVPRGAHGENISWKDQDLANLFAALDRHASVLWERGVRDHMIKLQQKANEPGAPIEEVVK